MQISSTKAFSIQKIEQKGPDWGYVVRTLVTVPTAQKDERGELDQIQGLKLAQAHSLFPHYDLLERDFRSKPRLYMGILSVNDYIQDLKAGRVVKSVHKDIAPKEVL